MTKHSMSTFLRLLAKANARMDFRNRPPVAPKYRTRCGAFARSTGKPCRRFALANGKCRNHGGLSKGPITADGKAKALANLKQNQL